LMGYSTTLGAQVLLAGANSAANAFAPMALGGTEIRLCSNGSTERARLHASGGLSYGSTTDPGAGVVAVTGSLVVTTQTPASAGAAGTAGTITWDASYVYVCVSTNTWKRVAIATW